MRKDLIGVGLVGTLFGMLGVMGIVNHLTKMYTKTDQSDSATNDLQTNITLCELEHKKEMLYAKKAELIDLLQQITQLKKELVSKAIRDA